MYMYNNCQLEQHFTKKVHDLGSHLVTISGQPCVEFQLRIFERRNVLAGMPIGSYTYGCICIICFNVPFLGYVDTELPSLKPSPTPHYNNTSEIETASPSLLELPWPEIIGGGIGFALLFVAMVILIILLSICAVVVRRRKLKAESCNKKGVQLSVCA